MDLLPNVLLSLKGSLIVSHINQPLTINTLFGACRNEERHLETTDDN